MIGGLAETMLGALVTLGYPAIAVIVGLESAGLPLPGEATLLSASYLAAMGHFSLPLVVGAAALGAVVGDSLGYLIGRQGGRRFLEKYGKHGGITPKKLAKADEYFMRHGGKTVFFGRFIVLLRILAGPLAGASRMPYRRFLVANIAGALAWATTMGTLGFFFGKTLAAVLNSLGVWALVAVAALLMLRFALRRALEHRLHKPDRDPAATYVSRQGGRASGGSEASEMRAMKILGSKRASQHPS
jgi:membrane protein DedA with SNARE-associated domain